MKISKRLMNEAKGRPPSRSSYFADVLRKNRKLAKKFGTAGHTRKK